MAPHTQADDLHLLLDRLPGALQHALEHHLRDELLEVVMDLGRPPQARYPEGAVALSNAPVSREDLAMVIASLGAFGDDNRAGIEGTLHRVSAIRNRKGEIIGLTLRVGRAVSGTVDAIRDLVEDGRSFLILGRPGIGKTTKLREVARLLADEFDKRVIVIDTSNEIAGDGDIPHPAIGSARRMQVPHTTRQAAVMIEAVENHMPEAIVIDEIGTEAECMAARTIAERGVQLVGTAHGNTLDNLIRNPTLSDLVGGVQVVTLGDEEARLRGTQKSIMERQAPPTFDAVVEMEDRDDLVVHWDTAKAVDRLLRGLNPHGERRGPGTPSEWPQHQRPLREISTGIMEPTPAPERSGPTRIHAYALSPDLVQRAIREMRLNARTVRSPEEADLLLTLRARSGDRRLLEAAERSGAPVYEVKKNAAAPIRKVLQRVFMVVPGATPDEVEEAAREAEQAIAQVRTEGGQVALSPRPPHLRRLQHDLAVRHRVMAESVGSEPGRYLVIHD